MRLFVVPLSALLFASFAFAQNAELSGFVKDPSDSVIPDATVKIMSRETGWSRTTQTNEIGTFHFSNLKPGTYDLDVVAPGFKKTVRERIKLDVAQSARLDVVLDVGSVEEKVTVTVEAVQVNAADATLGNAVGPTAITQLPLYARNVVGLLSLQPGVTPAGNVNGGKSDQGNVTLDGIDVNEQENRAAFTSVLRVTLDSVQEFRTITSNANADFGRSSGAQVSLITRSGTNEVHGSAYEYHRNTATAANSFFNNSSGLAKPKLLINIFGASAGGPIRRNRAFFFLNYEGRRDASESSALRKVPTTDFREGIVQYRRTDGTTARLTPQDLKTRIDPAGVGVNAGILELLKSYPLPNDNTTGDGLNTLGLRFTAPVKAKQDTYIARLDLQLDRAGRHQVFIRGNLQNDHSGGMPQFPGEPQATGTLDNSKGIAIGYSAVLKPSLIATLRYGLTRAGTETLGIQTASMVRFRDITDRYATTRGLSKIVPVHQISPAIAWSGGRHDLRAGAELRWIRNQKRNYARSFFDGTMNSVSLANGGRELRTPVPDLNSTFGTAYDDAVTSLLGIVSQAYVYYHLKDLEGDLLPFGEPVRRTFAMGEYEMYVNDTWRLSRSLTMTAGLRYSLMPPVREANGFQVSFQPGFAEMMRRRVELANQGRPQSEAGRFTYVDANSPEGRPFYDFHKLNFAPRFSIAWSSQATSGWRRFLLGGPGRSSVRAGWGMFYEMFGQAMINRFDGDTIGYSMSLQSPMGAFTSITAPRFNGPYQLPPQLIPAPPAQRGFPFTPGDIFSGTTAFDETIRPPYTMPLNFTVSREFKGGIYIQGSYVGLLSRRSLVRRDLTAAVNMRDPASGMTHEQAARELALLANRKTPLQQVPKIAFWENLWPAAANAQRNLTATQAIYEVYLPLHPSYLSALSRFDRTCTPACSKFGPFALYNGQFPSTTGVSSVGGGNYHSMQWTVRKRFGQGLMFDFNYTWSKSIDIASSNENGVETIINYWAPGQMKAVSSYDVTQSWSALWVAELPFGRHRRWLSGINRPLDALLGGWQLSGVLRQTTELPVSVSNGRYWPTHYNWAGWATQIGPVPAPTITRDAPPISGKPGPNLFTDPKAAMAAYDFTLPFETGQRNGVRGVGVFTLDFGLGKRFVMPYREGHTLQFRWEVFNATNAVRFSSLNLTLGDTSYGKFANSAAARQMQFGLRYEF